MTKAIGGAMTVCYNTTNDYARPIFNPIRSVRDVKWDQQKVHFDTSNRLTKTDTSYTTRRYKVGVDFDIFWDKSHGQRVLEACFWTGNPIDAIVLADRPAIRAAGFHSFWCVREFAEDFPLRDGQKIKVRLEPDGNSLAYGGVPGWIIDPSNIAGADPATFLNIGMDAQIYDNTGAQLDCEDIKLGVTAEFFDSSNRDMQFDSCISVRRKFNLEFNITFDETNTLHTALFNSFTDVPVALLLRVADGPIANAGTCGIQAWWIVTDFPFDGKLRDGVKVPVKAQPVPLNSFVGIGPAFNIGGLNLEGAAKANLSPQYFTVAPGGALINPFVL